MLGILTGLVVFLTAIDHWTTYLCLRGVVPGWSVSEANPLASWLFASVGLVPGLMVDTAVTGAAILFVLRTGRLSPRAKGACLLLLASTTAFAVTNNLEAVYHLGLAPLGGR